MYGHLFTPSTVGLQSCLQLVSASVYIVLFSTIYSTGDSVQQEPCLRHRSTFVCSFCVLRAVVGGRRRQNSVRGNSGGNLGIYNERFLEDLIAIY